jgi:aminoglycoside phosphotransferase (APT) family kinase protein
VEIGARARGPQDRAHPQDAGQATGLDVPAATAWLRAHVPELEEPLRFERVAGGRSNLTFTATDGAGRRIVLRRPPTGLVLQSAHDMEREHRIIAALRASVVPVPVARGYCADPAVIGAPFYVMDFAEGVIVRDEADALREFDEDTRFAASLSMADVLADLHGVEPDDVGLGDLGRREGYLDRQLRRMHRQFHDATHRAVPEVDEAHRRLRTRQPAQRRVSLVHGDYRIDNTVLRPDGSVTAVLDWELCTLGDPLVDLGALVACWLAPGEDARHMLSGTPTRVPGFATREQLVARYAERSGADVSELQYYVAFALWKLACIAEGILARYTGGAMGVSADAGIAGLADKVGWLAEAALDRLD